MGRALASAFLAAGHPTTVWNRTPGRADGLVESGAVETGTAAEAIAASDLVVICVLDHDARPDSLQQFRAAEHAVAMLDERVASPNQLAGWLGASLGTVAYHVRTLEQLGLATLAPSR